MSTKSSQAELQATHASASVVCGQVFDPPAGIGAGDAFHVDAFKTSSTATRRAAQFCLPLPSVPHKPGLRASEDVFAAA